MKHSFTVKREKWLHGEEWDNSYLLRPSDGKMCCLGFYALSCGLAKKDIFQKITLPEDVRLHSFSQDLLASIMIVNDLPNISYDREKALIDLFAATDIQIKFED